MKVKYSKDFEKAVRKLSGKRLESVKNAIREVKNASNISEITDCVRLVGFDFIYRIHIGGYRAFFNYHVEIREGIVYFLYLVPRGQAYAKGVTKNLRNNDA